MSQPSVEQLTYFLAVARYGSFSLAASELNISQPTLSTQLAEMEDQLGAGLFERGEAGALLSPRGRKLLPYARKVLASFDEFMEAADSTDTGAVTYRLGVKSTFGPYALPRIMPAIHALHKNLKLYVREEAPSLLEPKLENGELDLILTAFPTNSGRLSGERLLREDIKVVLPATHPLACSDTLRGEDLKGIKLLTTQEGHRLTRLTEQVATRFGAEVQVDYQGTSLDALRLMVVMDMGIALLPALYIHSEIRDDTALAVREIEGESFSRIIGIAWRSTSPARKFYRTLASDMRQVLSVELGDVVQVVD